MAIHEEQWEQVEMLENNELLIARLYMAYSEHFSDHRNLWNDLAEDEKKHAGMIRTLVHQIQDGSVTLGEERFDPASISMFAEYLTARWGKARNEVISREDAFQNALAIEHDLLERNFFRVFETDSEEMKIILEALESSTKQHRMKLTAAVQQAQDS